MERILSIFEDICKVPRGSGNMKKIKEYLVNFAKENNLEVFSDNANNVIIYKKGSRGYENAPTVILQGHTDMVCQKDEKVLTNFEKEGVTPYTDGDWIKARGTTLGADNGIAVAMILRILESKDIPHPPVEAVFTTDEEIGMIGAGKLDISKLKGKLLINLDSEDEDLTVSCAGGVDVSVEIPIEQSKAFGTKVSVEIFGLMGGHSGVEIHKGGKNAAAIMGNVLKNLKAKEEFYILNILGGDKSNAITNRCKAEIICKEPSNLKMYLTDILEDIKISILDIEPGFSYIVKECETGEYSCFSKKATNTVIKYLAHTPQGVQTMSKEIEGLVETSLNLGILNTKDNKVNICYALRSSKKEELENLKNKMVKYANELGAKAEASGYYPPWEYRENSKLRPLFADIYKNLTGKSINIMAIHAGLECAVFASKIEGVDCIATGPIIKGAHTTEEKLSILSTKTVFEMLTLALRKLKSL